MYSRALCTDPAPPLAMQLAEEHAARLATELEMQSRCELCRYAQHGVSGHLPAQLRDP